ncbi:MAG TPA: hypothetical protein VE178_17195 [Silvibacterium sp.]|jgi:hypothetical protein|nr:hypothetical protein [Silvibacterium sp.]
MNGYIQLCLAILSAAIVLATAWRLYVIYRRRMRWKLLTTSHRSLHIARERIVASPELPEEE